MPAYIFVKPFTISEQNCTSFLIDNNVRLQFTWQDDISITKSQSRQTGDDTKNLIIETSSCQYVFLLLELKYQQLLMNINSYCISCAYTNLIHLYVQEQLSIIYILLFQDGTDLLFSDGINKSGISS